MKTGRETISDQLTEWWMSRCRIVDIAFGIAVSNVYLRIIVLDYGLDFRFELPWCLNQFNPMNWVTHRILKWTRIDYKYVFWKISQWKSLELQICHGDALLAFDYTWTAHTDHWGHWAALTFAGVEGHIWYADARHWDDDKDEPLSDDSPERYEQSLVGWHKWAYQKAREQTNGRSCSMDHLMVDLLAEKCAEFECEQQE